MRKNQYRALKKIGDHLINTPLHPQWLVHRKVLQMFNSVGKNARGLVLDIGCAEQSVSSYLSAECEYIGLDNYSTAVEWYNTRPHVFATTYSTPFPDQFFDTVLLIDVIEHLNQPEKSIEEIVRLLKPDGRLILQAPFFYPLHDSPLDFHRWTIFGLRELASNNRLKVLDEQTIGCSAETIGMMVNMAITKRILINLERITVASFFLPLIIPLIPIVNCMAWLLALFGDKNSDIMPMGYRVILEK